MVSEAGGDEDSIAEDVEDSLCVSIACSGGGAGEEVPPRTLCQ